MFKHYKMKVANMRKEQSFTLYPYTGGENIFLQSDNRFAIVNLKTGKGIIDSKNHNYPNRQTLQVSNLPFTIDSNILTDIITYLEKKSGIVSDGVLSIENKVLFSEI